MCGRFTLTRKDVGGLAAELAAQISDEDAAQYRPRYNVAPGDTHLILIAGRRLVPARWGFSSVINARAESVEERPLFRDAFRQRRCVVPTDGFFEWEGPKKDRRPIWFHDPESGLVLLAGLYEPDDEGRLAFTILTTAANEIVAPVHDRMPAVLAKGEPDEVTAWLRAPRLDLLRAAPDGALATRHVSERVNTPIHDDEECLAPAPPPPRQLKLL